MERYIGYGQNRHGGQYYLTIHGTWNKEKHCTPDNLAVFDSKEAAEVAVSNSDEITSCWADVYRPHLFDDAVQEKWGH